MVRGHTLNRVGLGQLGQVGQQVFRDVVPGVALAQPQVDVGAGQLVDVELSDGVRRLHQE